MQQSKAGASRALSATDGSDISPERKPPAKGSPDTPQPVSDRRPSMQAGDLSDLDDRSENGGNAPLRQNRQAPMERKMTFP